MIRRQDKTEPNTEVTLMPASLRVLLNDIVDYAGLFPPARLEIDEAIRNYARYRCAKEAWMLGRFVCPASRLKELVPYVDELFSTERTLRLSLLGRGGETSEQFLKGMKSDLDDISEFCARTDARRAVEAFEVRLPDDASDEGGVCQLLDSVAKMSDAHQTDRLPIFYEPPCETEWRSAWPAIMRGIAQHGGGARSNSALAGFKLRCGGADATAYPSIEQLASAIAWAQAARVPMKFTAGLHHPLRHYNEDAHTDMHGFINVFTAGTLATSDGVNQEQIRAILASQDVESFEFTEDAIAWKGIRISCDTLAKARRSAVTSFGSCSFDEPLEDLRRLGLL